VKNIEFFSLDEKFELAQNIASKFEKELIIPEIAHFSDSEIRVELSEGIDVSRKTAFIIYSTVDPVNRSYMKLFFLADLLKRKGITKVHAIIPYIGYSRQCGCKKGEGIGHAKIIAQLIECSGIDSVVACEIHDRTLESFFCIPFKNILLRRFIANHIAKTFPDLSDCFLVAPDKGARSRVEDIAKLLSIETMFFSKKRFSDHKVDIRSSSDFEFGSLPERSSGVNEEPRRAIIIDDIINTGGTALKVANKLKERGVEKIYAYFIHPVLSGNVIENLEKSPIDTVFVSDTVELQENEKIDKIKVFDVSDVLFKYLKDFI